MVRQQVLIGWVALLLSLVLGQTAAARSYDDVVDSGYLTVAVYRDFPPYSFQEDGVAKGVDVVLAQRIARAMSLQLKLHWVVPDENLEDDLRNNVWKGHYLDKDSENPLAQKNIADVMLRVPYDREFAYRQDTQTGELVNEQVVMFAPYQRESWRIVFDQKKIEAVPTMALFQYHPIGVEVDSLPSVYLGSAFRGRMRQNVKHYPSATLAFQRLLAGDIDAVMAMRGEVDYLAAQQSDDRYQLADNGFPGLGQQKWDVGMAVKSTYRQLAYAIEAVVEEMVREGEMQQLYQQYGMTYEIPALYQAP